MAAKIYIYQKNDGAGADYVEGEGKASGIIRTHTEDGAQ